MRRWGFGRAASSAPKALVPLAVALGLAVTTTACGGGSKQSSSSSSPTMTSLSDHGAGYSFRNPANGARGADPEFLAAPASEGPLCAGVWQVLTDWDILANQSVSGLKVNMAQVNNDLAALNGLWSDSLTSIILKSSFGSLTAAVGPWGAVDAASHGDYRTASNDLTPAFMQACTGPGPYTYPNS